MILRIMLLSITVKNVNVVGRIESDLPDFKISNHWRKTKSNKEKLKSDQFDGAI